METNEGFNSGVTVIGAEAPSSYHVAPRTENASQIGASSAMNMNVTPVSAGFTGSLEKKKRGRPRKYGPDGAARTLSPMPISSSAPTSGDFSGGKRGRGRAIGYQSKQYKGPDMDNNSGDWTANSVGTSFTPHIITVNAGEDITMKVISFSQQGPRAICILSANGAISNVTLRQPDSSGGTLMYEGRFEILSLSGSFMPTETQGTRSRSGGMSVSLASPDGRVVGGSVGGLLVAASPVQVIVGSFLPGGYNDQKPKKLKNDAMPATLTPNSTYPGAPASNVDNEDGIDEHDLHETNNIMKSNHGSGSPYRRETWGSMPEQRNTTDINISLPAA